jgi:hypothetical protein
MALDVSSSSIDKMNHRFAWMHLVRAVVNVCFLVDFTVHYRLEALVPVNMTKGGQSDILNGYKIVTYPAM